MVKSISWIQYIDEKCARDVCLFFRRVKILEGTVIMQFHEFNDHTYFLSKGQINVYVYNDKSKEKYLLHEIKSGGSFNFVNSLLGHYSLFHIEAVSNCEVYTVHRDDMIKVSKTNGALHGAIERVRTQFAYVNFWITLSA